MKNKLSWLFSHWLVLSRYSIDVNGVGVGGAGGGGGQTAISQQSAIDPSRLISLNVVVVVVALNSARYLNQHQA